MPGPERRPRGTGLWSRIKRLLGLRPEPPPPPAPPPDEEPALVPSGPSGGPTREGGAALELPEEPHDVDARGRND